MISALSRVAARIAAAVAAYAAAVGIDIDPGVLEDGLSVVFIALAIPVATFLEDWLRQAGERVRSWAVGRFG